MYRGCNNRNMCNIFEFESIIMSNHFLAGDGSKKIRGCWDSIHVIEVQEKSGGNKAHYKLTSTAMLWLQVKFSAFFICLKTFNRVNF